MQHILGRHRGRAHAIERELVVAGQVVAQHVHQLDHGGVLGRGVDAVREGRVGGRGEDVRLAGQAHHIGRMAAARALDVVRVDRPAVDHAQRVLDEQPLVESVGVQADLHVVGVGDAQGHVERGGVRADVLVDLEPAGTCGQHPLERLGAAGRAAGEHQRVQRRLVQRGVDVAQRPGRVGAEVPDGAVVLDDERREARGERLVADARAEQVHVGVDRPRGRDQALARHDRGIGAEHDVDAIHDVGVARPADRDDATVGDADRGLAHAEDRIDDEHLRDGDLDGVERGLRHQPVTRGLGEAAEHLVAALLVVGLDLDHEAGVAEAHAVADGRAVDAGVCLRVEAHVDAPR